MHAAQVHSTLRPDRPRLFARPHRLVLVAALATACCAGWAQDRMVYKCPGNLYTDTLSSREASERGCKPIDSAPVTVIQSGPVRRPGSAESAGAASSGSGAAPRPADQRVEPFDQKARDADKRRILEAELRREEDRLAGLRQEWNGGEPERRGDEKNYQKYLDRKAGLKSGIDRSESDVAALKRELSKLPPPTP